MIAEKLNGDLDVFSEPDKGTTFVFSLKPEITKNPKKVLQKHAKKFKKKNEASTHQLELIKESENESYSEGPQNLDLPSSSDRDSLEGSVEFLYNEMKPSGEKVEVSIGESEFTKISSIIIAED